MFLGSASKESEIYLIQLKDRIHECISEIQKPNFRTNILVTDLSQIQLTASAVNVERLIEKHHFQ